MVADLERELDELLEAALRGAQLLAQRYGGELVEAHFDYAVEIPSDKFAAAEPRQR